MSCVVGRGSDSALRVDMQSHPFLAQTPPWPRSEVLRALQPCGGHDFSACRRGFGACLKSSGRCGVTLVTQICHKEKMKNRKRIPYISLPLILRGFSPVLLVNRSEPLPRHYIHSHKKDMRMLIKFSHDPQPGIGHFAPGSIPRTTNSIARNGRCCL